MTYRDFALFRDAVAAAEQLANSWSCRGEALSSQALRLSLAAVSAADGLSRAVDNASLVCQELDALMPSSLASAADQLGGAAVSSASAFDGFEKNVKDAECIIIQDGVKIAATTSRAREMLYDQFKPIESFGMGLLTTSLPIGSLASIDIVRAAELASVSAGRYLAEFNWEKFVPAYGWGDEFRRLTDDLLAAYVDLALPSIPSIAVFPLESLAAIEFYNHISLLRGIASDPSSAGLPEEDSEDSVHKEIDEKSQLHLEGLLAKHYPDFIEPWLGAQEALTRQHDRARHFCASQRALLKQLLLRSAPNQAVCDWTSDPAYFSRRVGGSPTWRARLAYLCDKAKSKGYTQFVITDVSAAFTVWNRLNEGDHEVPLKITDRQLSDLRVRSNCLLLMALILSVAE